MGSSHLAQGAPCQDAFACQIWQGRGATPILIAALADGAGSAECAAIGSALATSLFTEIVSEAFDEGSEMDSAEDILRYAVGEMQLAFQLKADFDGREINDYASTLLAVILSPFGGVISQIGDGATVIDDGVSGWQVAHWPDHGEYANCTSFLTEENALETLRIAAFDQPVKRVAMFSDGLERLVLNFRVRMVHKPFFDSVFRRLEPTADSGYLAQASEELGGLLASDKVSCRTDDDTSLLCAVLVGPD